VVGVVLDQELLEELRRGTEMNSSFSERVPRSTEKSMRYTFSSVSR
jgi:hypothetical protein